ncbi:hypothetical protein D9M71_412940 [compost metagenome]
MGPATSGLLVSIGGYPLVASVIAGIVVLTLLMVLVPLARVRAHEQSVMLAASA